MTISEKCHTTPKYSHPLKKWEEIATRVWSEKSEHNFEDTGSLTRIIDGLNFLQSDNIKFGIFLEICLNEWLESLNLPNVEVIRSDSQYRKLPFEKENLNIRNHFIQLPGKPKKTQIDVLLRITDCNRQEKIVYLEMKSNINVDTEKAPAVVEKKKKILEYYRKDTEIVEAYVFCIGFPSSRTKISKKISKLGYVLGFMDLLEMLTGRKKGEEGDSQEFDDFFEVLRELKQSTHPDMEKHKKIEAFLKKRKVDKKTQDDIMCILKKPLEISDYSHTEKKVIRTREFKEKQEFDNQAKTEFDFRHLLPKNTKEITNITCPIMLKDDPSMFYYLGLPKDYTFPEINFFRKDHQDLFDQFQNTRSKCCILVGHSPFIENLYSGGNGFGLYIKGMINKTYKGSQLFVDRFNWDVKERKILVITNF